MAKDHFKVYPTSHPTLRGLVSHYYFHWCDAPAATCEFLYYPHFKHAITTYTNSGVSYLPNGSSISAPLEGKVQTLFSRVQHQATSVSLSGRFYKIGIVLEAAAINSFLPSSLKADQAATIGEFDHFGAAWTELALRLWDKTETERTRLLDQFLVERLTHFSAQKSTQDQKIYSNFRHALTQLLADPELYTLQKLSDLCCVSPKTTTRYFDRYVGCNFSAFKKIVRFRQALDAYHHQKPSNLTELALLANFYDQPDFNRNIKSLSGKRPAALFGNLGRMEGDTFWTFEK